MGAFETLVEGVVEVEEVEVVEDLEGEALVEEGEEMVASG